MADKKLKTFLKRNYRAVLVAVCLLATGISIQTLYYQFSVENSVEPRRPIELTLPIERPKDEKPHIVNPFSNATATRDHRQLGAPFLFVRNYKNFHGRQNFIVDGKPIFDTEVNTDQNGRRCLDRSCKEQSTSCGQIALYSGSKIFGYGVSDEESLPAQIKKYFPKIAIFNYGVVGSSYVDLLTQLKSGELKATLNSDTPTLFVSFWEADRFFRMGPSLGFPGTIGKPCYTENAQTGRLDYDGNFVNCAPIKSFLVWTLSKLDFLRFHFSNFNFQSETGNQEHFIRDQKEIDYEIKRQFSKTIFLPAAVAYTVEKAHLGDIDAYSESTHEPSVKIDLTKQIQLLKENGIRVDYLPYDPHPTAPVIAALAQELQEPLKKVLVRLGLPNTCF